MALYLSEAEVQTLLDMPLALKAVRSAFRQLAEGQAIDLPRERVRSPQVIQHILQGALLSEGILGYKAYHFSRNGTQFKVFLHDANDGKTLAILEANYLGMMRTGAASGIATELLANPEATTLALIGAGWQAQGQLRAIAAVRPLQQVKVYSRNPAKAEIFCQKMREQLPGATFQLETAATATDCLNHADILSTTTTASTPIFSGELLPPGIHVNAVGSNALWRRELDEIALQKADHIVVDSRETALREAGDLLPLLEKGRIHARQLVELGDILIGRQMGRQHPQAITIFESQGLATLDLAVAWQTFQRAQQQGLGRVLTWDSH